MASGGMRRILKYRVNDPFKHMQNKLNAGLYDIKPQRGSARGGSSIYPSTNYPPGYDILLHNPPIAEAAFVTSDWKLDRKLKRYMGKRARREAKKKVFSKQQGPPGEIVLPTDKYVKDYLRRHDNNNNDKTWSYATENSKMRRNDCDYPEQTIGIGDLDAYHGYDKGRITDAFLFAKKQYEFMQKHYNKLHEEKSGGGGGNLMTEEELEKESIRAVEEILKEESRAERFYARRMAQNLKKEEGVVRDEKTKTDDERFEEEKDTAGLLAQDNGDVKGKKEVSSASTFAMLDEEANEDDNDDEDEARSSDGSLPSIFHSNEQAAFEMTLWSDRLSQYSYHKWTLGAVTALDHWIATSVLQYSERTWQLYLLERRDVSKWHDVQVARSALFPETMMMEEQDDEYDDAALADEGHADDVDDAGEMRSESETDRSIDELLASLSSPDDDDDDFWGRGDDEKESNTSTKEKGMKEEEALAGDEDEDGDFDDDNLLVGDWDETDDEKHDRLLKGLKKWQAKNHGKPYEEWSEKERKKFNTWLVDYVSILSDDKNKVDMNETREAILSESYYTNEQEDEMWKTLQDETNAEMLLHDLRISGTKYLDSLVTEQGDSGGEDKIDEDERQHLRAFLDLSYEEQLHKLRSIGALRPIHDSQYTKMEESNDANITSSSTNTGVTGEEKLERFVNDNIDIIKSDVKVDGLVIPDLNGPLTAKDLYGLAVDRHRFKHDAMILGKDKEDEERRKRMEKHDLILFRSWNRHRANVANRQEDLFKDGKIGLDGKEIGTEEEKDKYEKYMEEEKNKRKETLDTKDVTNEID